MVLLLSDISFFMYIAQKVLSAPATCLEKTRFTRLTEWMLFWKRMGWDVRFEPKSQS